MSAMETQGKNTTGVQEELIRILQSDDAHELIESMVNKMAVIEEAHYRIRELREAVQPHIAKDLGHDEEYWIAAYLVRPHASKMVEKIKQLREIQHEIAELEERKKKISKREWDLEEELGDLDSAQENIAGDIKKLISKDFDSCIELDDLLYESTRKWVAKQLSDKRS